VKLTLRNAHQHDIAGGELARAQSSEMFQQCSIQLELIFIAQSVVLANSSPIDAEGRKNDPNTVESLTTAPLKTETRADERASALGKISRHVAQAPG
jgi:hypothetical protein